jgi:hypothetical protein
MGENWVARFDRSSASSSSSSSLSSSAIQRIPFSLQTSLPMPPSLLLLHVSVLRISSLSRLRLPGLPAVREFLVHIRECRPSRPPWDYFSSGLCLAQHGEAALDSIFALIKPTVALTSARSTPQSPLALLLLRHQKKGRTEIYFDCYY